MSKAICLIVAVLALACVAQSVRVSKSMVDLAQNIQLASSMTAKARALDVFDSDIATVTKDVAATKFLKDFLHHRFALNDAAIGIETNKNQKATWQVIRDVVAREICLARFIGTEQEWKDNWKERIGLLYMLPGTNFLGPLKNALSVKGYNAERSAVIFKYDTLDENLAVLFRALQFPTDGATNYDTRTLLHLLDRSAAYGEAIAFTDKTDPKKTGLNYVNNRARGSAREIYSRAYWKSLAGSDPIPEGFDAVIAKAKTVDDATRAKNVAELREKCYLDMETLKFQFEDPAAGIIYGKSGKKHMFSNRPSHILTTQKARPPKGVPMFRKGVFTRDTLAKITPAAMETLGLPKISADENNYMKDQALYTKLGASADPKYNDDKTFAASVPNGAASDFFKSVDHIATPAAPVKQWTSGGVIFDLDFEGVSEDSKKWQGFTLPYSLAAGPSGTTDEIFQHADLVGVARTGFGGCLMRDAAMSNMIIYNHHTFAEIMQGSADLQRTNLQKWSETEKDHLEEYFKCDEFNDNKQAHKPVDFQWTAATAMPTFTVGGNAAKEKTFATPASRRTSWKAAFDKIKGTIGAAATTPEYAALLNTDFGAFNFAGGKYTALQVTDPTKVGQIKALCKAVTSKNIKTVICGDAACACA